MKTFTYTAEKGGSLFIQEGGFANVGIDANTEPLQAGKFQITEDILAKALEQYGEKELPPFKLTIEPL